MRFTYIALAGFALAMVTMGASCGMSGLNVPKVKTPYGETSGTEIIVYPLPDIEVGMDEMPPARSYNLDLQQVEK